MKLAYVSGPYTADTKEQKIANIQQARKIAVELWDLGYAVICPHSNTAFFNEMCKVAKYEDFIVGDLVMLEYCDVMVLTPDWWASNGARIEAGYAHIHLIPIYIYPNMPESER